MPFNTFADGLVLDQVTGKGIPASVGYVIDVETGDPIDVYSMSDDVNPFILATNRYGYFPQYRADSTVKHTRVTFGKQTLDRLAFENLDEVRDAATAAQVAAEAAQLAAENASLIATAPASTAIDTYLGAPSGQVRNRMPLLMLDYAVGDGVTDDTTAVQTAFAAAISQGRALYSPPGKEYLIDPITVAGALRLEGEYSFSARTDDQAHVFNITSIVDWSRASVVVNAKNRALYAIRGSNFSRSQFGYLEVSRAKIWGMQFDASGNNNVVSVNKFKATLSGAKLTRTLTETAETANVLTSSAGYGTFTIGGTALTSAQVATGATYWVISAGLAYKVRSITTTTIEVFNLKASTGVGGTVSVDLIIGGGLNIPAYGDNGVGVWGSMDIASNPGCGIHIAALYGHTFNNLVAQANGIGLSSSDYTTEMVLIKPYFETNAVNYVSWSYMAGVMLAPLLDLSTMQNCINRLAANGSYDPRMVIIKDNSVGLASPLIPGSNPGSRTLLPGQCYAYHRTAAGTWNFVIDNSAQYAALGAYFIMVDLSHANSLINCPISITLANNNGETIEGVAFGTAYTSAATGKAILKLYRIGTDWKVTVTPNRVPATAVTAAPVYVGQLAVVGAVGYIATGTSASTDWKQIT